MPRIFSNPNLEYSPIISIAESMKAKKITFAKDSFQNPTLATLTIMRISTQIGIQIGCCISSIKNLNGFLIVIDT